MTNLLPEEKVIRDLLGQLRCIKYTQAIKLLNYTKTEDVSVKILRNLLKRQYMFETTDGYIKICPKDEPNPDMINAVWAFTYFYDKIDIDYGRFKAFYPAKWPAQIDFLSNGIQYEIVAVSSQESFRVEKLLSGTRENVEISSEEDPKNYIFVVNTKEDAIACIRKVPKELTNQNRIIFMLLEERGDEEPAIKMMKV